MSYQIDNPNIWPIVIPDATPTSDGVMSASLFGTLVATEAITFDVDFAAEDTKDIVFANGFIFSGDYSVLVTPYVQAADATVQWNLVPRPGDPAPPAAKAPSGFRIVLSAPVTGRFHIRCFR